MQERKVHNQILACQTQTINTFIVQQSRWNLTVQQEKAPKKKSAQETSHFLQVHGAYIQFFFQAIQCEICCLFLYPIGALYELINQKLVYYIIPKYLFTKSMILFVSLSRIKVTEEIDYLLGCRCTSIASFLSYHISS